MTKNAYSQEVIDILNKAGVSTSDIGFSSSDKETIVEAARHVKEAGETKDTLSFIAFLTACFAFPPFGLTMLAIMAGVIIFAMFSDPKKEEI